MAEVALVVELEIEPDRLEEFLEVVRAHGARSREREPGCLRFDCLRPREAQSRVILVEVYADDAALESHWASDHMADYRRRVEGMIRSRTAHRCDFA
jgi:(4S)-4-hydroxy-5-phosphonooxypentane-2,3-dione isomerase